MHLVGFIYEIISFVYVCGLPLFADPAYGISVNVYKAVFQSTVQVLLDVKPCGLVNIYRSFEVSY